jgi:hypothetical protein
MPFGFDQRPNLFDLPFLANEERAAHDSRVGAAHELFLLPCAELSDRFMVGIAEQGEIQFLFFLEEGERFDGIGAHPEDGDAVLVKFRFCVTKLGRFNRSTRSIRLGVEEKQDALTFEVIQGDFLAVVG